jgi:hypothetical protein
MQSCVVAPEHKGKALHKGACENVCRVIKVPSVGQVARAYCDLALTT